MSSQTLAKPAATSAASGWVEAGLYVLCIALLSVAYAVAAAQAVHTVVFILYSLLISATALLAVTGPGRNAAAIVRDPASWLVGLANMVVEGSYALLLGYVAPAPGSLMIRLSIPMTLLIGVIVFGRRPPPLVWLGVGIVTIVVLSMLASVEPARMAAVIACAAIGGLAVGVRAFASEFHKWNRAASTLAEKVQVTALVTLVTGVAGLTTVGALMAAIGFGLLPPTPLVPAPAALIHPPTIVLALMVGGALYTAMTYLSFSSVIKIRSENFIASSAFMPLAALGVQFPAAAAGLIHTPPFDWRLLPAMLAAIAGVMMMIWGGRRPT